MYFLPSVADYRINRDKNELGTDSKEVKRYGITFELECRFTRLRMMIVQKANKVWIKLCLKLPLDT